MDEYENEKCSVTIIESYQPGSYNTVLKNKLGITSSKAMKARENDLLIEAEESVQYADIIDHKYTAKDMCGLNKLCLQAIYNFAGTYRILNVPAHALGSVNNSYDFATAPSIKDRMQEFEKDYLSPYTPTRADNERQLAEILAIVHIQYSLIHPFRKGNGRVGRILATLMAMQAGVSICDVSKGLEGFSIFDFRSMTGDNQESYFSAIEQGADCNYEPMIKIFEQIIQSSTEDFI